jgi:3-methylcrotonyl-CoA carboxylase beta subunit
VCVVPSVACRLWHTFSRCADTPRAVAGKTWSKDAEEKFKAPIRAQYEKQGSAYYSTARLWDDGIIEPSKSREVLGLSLSAALNAPVENTKFGVFRM